MARCHIRIAKSRNSLVIKEDEYVNGPSTQPYSQAKKTCRPTSALGLFPGAKGAKKAAARLDPSLHSSLQTHLYR